MKKIILYFMFALFLVTSCSNNDESGMDEVRFRINSHTVDCEGVQIGKCLLVQEGDKIGTDEWEYFYFEDSIKGFTFEPGFIYELLVRKASVENPPEDGSSIDYSLVRIISKRPI